MRLGEKIIPTDDMRKLLALCVDWYGYVDNLCGGELHVILDDDNTDDDSLNDALERCVREEYDNYELAEKIINGFFPLTQDQRNWVTYNIYDAIDGKEREVFEEIEEEWEKE